MAGKAQKLCKMFTPRKFTAAKKKRKTHHVSIEK